MKVTTWGRRDDTYDHGLSRSWKLDVCKYTNVFMCGLSTASTSNLNKKV